jgi:hypothetical protein
MNSNSTAPLRKSFRLRWIFVTCGLIGLYFLRLALAPDYYTASFFHHLVFELPVGWYEFLKRTTPWITMETSAIAIALAAAIIAVLILHLVGRSSSHAWSWRSTLVAAFLPVVLFAIILSSGGIQTRVTQLFVDPRPVVNYGYREYFAWREIEILTREKTGTSAPSPLVR